ncbi:MAG: universal stress protein [Maioricimonas sp. JB049]
MLPRFRHILIPVDFTEKNRAALEIAFEMSAHNRARVTLLHVIETLDAIEDDDDVQDLYDRLADRASSELESLVQRFSDSGQEAEYKVRYGKRVLEIVNYAADRDVDLVVMSSHPIDRQHPVQSIATVSYQVSLLCECPVLLVK